MNDKDQIPEENDTPYIQPNIDIELPKEKRQTCREIVAEIKNFGVNQRQILFLIQLLAMELENNEAMKTIVRAVGSVRNNIPPGNKLIVPSDPKQQRLTAFNPPPPSALIKP